MKNDPKKLVDGLLSGSTRSLARVISLIEDNQPEAKQCLELLYPHSGSAYKIGVTGPPGAGKSTLVDKLVAKLSQKGKKVAILAIDPSSPFSGGAVLGDRIRMNEAIERDNVFIRSMATRGALGGVAPRTAESVFALDAAGFEYIIIETVGVGQAEVEIVRNADSVVLVMVPGMGDSVQALKAGIIEIADIFAINKSDHPGADRLEKELITILSLAEKPDWKPPIRRTEAHNGTGVDALLESVDQHRCWASESGALQVREEQFVRDAVLRLLSESLMQEATEVAKSSGKLEDLIKAVLERKTNPIEAANSIKALVLSSDRSN